MIAAQRNIKLDNNNISIGAEFINIDFEVQAKLYNFLLKASV